MNRSLVNSELSLFSYEILGLVGSGGAGAHDLLRMARHGRILDWAGRASTTPNRNGSPSSATSTHARSQAGHASAPSTPSPTRADRRSPTTRAPR
jgi:hypothetical protein